MVELEARIADLSERLSRAEARLSKVATEADTMRIRVRKLVQDTEFTEDGLRALKVWCETAIHKLQAHVQEGAKSPFKRIIRNVTDS